MDEERDGARLADELAAQCIADDSAPKAAASAPAERRASRAPLIVSAVSLAVVLVQIPSLRASLAPQASLRAGVQETDRETDACIDTLWAIAAVLREGESADVLKRLPLSEPVTHAAYAVSEEGGEIVVACPNPRVHGLSRLRITEHAPMPEAVR